MKWEADQRSGFIGWEAPEKAGHAPQPLHRGVVDIDAAFRRCRHELDLFAEARKHPDAPAFTGGVVDSWPAWAVDALAIGREEEVSIRGFLMSTKGVPNG